MWGKRRKAKRTRAWGFRSTIKEAPSKGRPATRKRWVARVTRLKPRNVKHYLRPLSITGVETCRKRKEIG